MSEKSYTPGPWAFETGPQGDPDLPDVAFIIVEERDRGEVIATALEPVPSGSPERNARLIAASPKLLGMLRRLALEAQRVPELARTAAEAALAVCVAEGTTEFAEEMAARSAGR